jgi:hypothetical protein
MEMAPKTDPGKPWAFLPLQMSLCVGDLCSMAVSSEIRDESNSLFWKDQWILSQHAQDFAPLILNMIPKK